MSIDITGVNKRFGDFVALDDVTVSLPTGQLTALLGPSGGGKSTLLRIIAGLDNADTGTVSIEGVDATRLPPQKRNVGFVFQHYAVFKHMSVAKNVAFGLEIRKRPKDEVARARRRAAQAGAPLAVRRPAAVAALRRPAPAHGAGAGARRRAEGAAARRAVRRPGRQGPQGAARVAAPPARRGPRDHRLRHARPGGGDGGRRRDRGDQRGPGRAGRHARPALRPAGQRLRDGLPWRRDPRHGAAGPARTTSRSPPRRTRPAPSRARSPDAARRLRGAPDRAHGRRRRGRRALTKSHAALGLEEGATVWITPDTGAIPSMCARSADSSAVHCREFPLGPADDRGFRVPAAGPPVRSRR